MSHIRVTITPRDALRIIESANSRQLPHDFVQIPYDEGRPGFRVDPERAILLEWNEDGGPDPERLHVTLNADGTWLATVRIDRGGD